MTNWNPMTYQTSQTNTPHADHVIVIAGQTATGKSDLAVQLALQHNGEIISADSRQVYRGLDIGSNKITHADMSDIAHWGIDITAPGTRFSVSDFQTYSRNAMHDILGKGKTPIIVGGTGLYIDATVFSDFDFSGTRGSIDYANASYAIPAQYTWIGLCSKRAHLVERIQQRAELHAPALCDEISRLLRGGVSRDWIHGLGLEYRYGIELIESLISKDDFIQTLTTKTWQYARRQATWFKRNPRIQWFDISETNRHDILSTIRLHEHDNTKNSL